MDAAGLGRLSGGLAPGEAIMERVELAIVDAIEAVHATRVINLLAPVDIDTRRLALVLAKVAALALRGVDDRTEHGEA